ncbi:hypothetical protein Q5752_005846 [Cryptotrichosporon argae]
MQTIAGNPLRLLTRLTALQWAFFLCGWFAWIIDAIDFFAVSLATTRLATYFHKPVGDVTLAITLTLLFRPVGAVTFGLLCDRYGRKWPLVTNLVMLAAISLGTGFVTTFRQFLGVRALFGCLMGGPWGMAVSLSLENMPIECRGLFSGLLQLGYPVGYLVIAAINLNARVAAAAGWRILFYAGAGFSLFAALLRLAFPESTFFAEQKRARSADGTQDVDRTQTADFVRHTGRMLRQHWARCIFAIILMTAFNFYSHGSQDLYPTYIQKDKGLTAHQSTICTIIGNCGAVIGCAIGGFVSQILGRRITMMAFVVFCCAMLPLWLLPTSFAGLAAGAFFVQFGVQGAYGVVPVYLSEISPEALRATWPGVAYQLGNMVASASAQIEATAGDKLTDPTTGLPAYGKVSAILIGVAGAVIVGCCLVGREAHAVQYESGAEAAAAEAQPKMVDDHEKGVEERIEHA